MISSSVLSRGATFLNVLPPGIKTSTLQSPVYSVGEYVVSASNPTAKSQVDYLESPLEQIRTQINAWLSSSGSQTRVETEDATLLVAPTSFISQELFDAYEPVFRTVMRYRTHFVESRAHQSNLPSEAQKNAALLGLANLIATLMPAPYPMLLDDGTVGVYWRRDKCYASIDFEVDGDHSWAGTDGTNYFSGVWKVPGEQLPEAIGKLVVIRS